MKYGSTFLIVGSSTSDNDSSRSNICATDLGPPDIVSSQRVSSRLLTVARDNKLWQAKCFEKAPSASTANASRPDALADLTGALGGLSLSETPQPPSRRAGEQRTRASKRSRAITQWDQTSTDEKIDWYSEYVGRHAPLSTTWCESDQDIRGVALHEAGQKIVGCLDDGSISIWDIREREIGRRKFRKVARSVAGTLFANAYARGQPSVAKTPAAFSGIVDGISIDSARQKAYIAMDQALNEVDLETLQVVSQSSYAWPITALSTQGEEYAPISVGTSWSLHLYDPRAPLRDRSRSPEDLMRTAPGEPEDSIAFLPNYSKGQSRHLLDPKPLPTSSGPTTLSSILLGSRQRRRSRMDLADYAHMEPGPQSILHHGDDEILIAGRFPSILSYDRRFFPRLQGVMHSGARLSSLASIPHPPKAARGTSATSTLIACGEYNGRGSLEIYAMPHGHQARRQSSGDFGLGWTSPELGAADREHALASQEQEYQYSYKNRQEASSSKLLSVATQGTRIVFSDAEGGIKWIERDGRGLARRWNINSWQLNETGGAPGGELVARKIMSLEATESRRGSRGDGDLMVFTGEKVGIVTTKRYYEDHEELIKAFEDKVDLGEKEEQAQAEEYSKTMRRALERQADERRWMSQFRLKRGTF